MMSTPRSRRLVWVVSTLLFVALIGVGAAGWFLDEPMPDDQDLLLVPPSSGEHDPFRKFAEDPPREMLASYYRIVEGDLDEPELISESTVMRVLKEDPSLRNRMLRWATDFDEALRVHGGDPRHTSDATCSEWSRWNQHTNSLHFEFGLLFRAAAMVESFCGDPDRAFQLLGIGFRVEDWQARTHPEAEFESLRGLLQTTILLIEIGRSKQANNPHFLEEIQWAPSAELRRAFALRFYAGFKSSTLENLQSSDLNSGSLPPRTKPHRLFRRFAQLLRESFQTGELPETEPSHPIFRYWIDPHGDQNLAVVTFFWWEAVAEIEGLAQMSACIRVSLAILEHEERTGQLPDRLEDLVPDSLSELPAIHLRPNFDREHRILSGPWSGDLNVRLDLPQRWEGK